MTLVGQRSDGHIRQANKEPEWSSICNNVFDQYLEFDDPFMFGIDQHERSNSSDDSNNLFDFSGSSRQSNHTSDTSPIPSWDPLGFDGLSIEAKQPKAKEPIDFWARKLHALEQNAAESEIRQQKLRSAKSHPDFLSLGGFPSPPALPPFPIDQSFSAQHRRSRISANGRKTPTQRCVTTSRSVSRGRTTGVTKTVPLPAVNPYATIRKINVSPSKMMNPSRYRAGFKDVWAERIQQSPKKYELCVPTQPFPVSPPLSGRLPQDEVAVFESPVGFNGLSYSDDQISPLANTFQQARIHTPLTSPLLSPDERRESSYFDPELSLSSNPYITTAAETVPLNDTAPLFPERTSSLAANRIQTFDFGFSSSPDIDQWSGAPFAEPPAGYHHAAMHNKAAYVANDGALRRTDYPDVGLGISCNPSLVSNNHLPPTIIPDTTILPPTTYVAPPPSQSAIPHYHASSTHIHCLPSTPQHHRHRRISRFFDRSISPSPPLTSPRQRRTPSRPRRSSSKHHRRTKSSSSSGNTTSGGTTSSRRGVSVETGGFVNFTPQDHGKILNGVAPSGSSKTKARREKEAAEKRRRLSQAAMKAIVDAGGDPEVLGKAVVEGEM